MAEAPINDISSLSRVVLRELIRLNIQWFTAENLYFLLRKNYIRNKIMQFIIVTGSAGFIGSAVSTKLLERGDSIVGIDNHNDYYDPKIKDSRLEKLKRYSNSITWRWGKLIRGY